MNGQKDGAASEDVRRTNEGNEEHGDTQQEGSSGRRSWKRSKAAEERIRKALEDVEIPRIENVPTPADVRRIQCNELMSTAKLAYEVLYLFWCARSDSGWRGWCDVKTSKISEEIGGIAARHIQQAIIPQLEAAGLVKVVRGVGDHKCNLYIACNSTSTSEHTSMSEHTSTSEHTSDSSTSTSEHTMTSTSEHTLQDNTRQTYQDSTPHTPQEGETLPYSEIVQYLNEKTGKEYKATSRKTRQLIQARFKEGWTLQDFRRVIDTKTAQWVHDAKMAAYLRPETLFGTKFESYLNEKAAPLEQESTSWADAYERQLEDEERAFQEMRRQQEQE